MVDKMLLAEIYWSTKKNIPGSTSKQVDRKITLQLSFEQNLFFRLTLMTYKHPFLILYTRSIWYAFLYFDSSFYAVLHASIYICNRKYNLDCQENMYFLKNSNVWRLDKS